jgi:hypothetical protein
MGCRASSPSQLRLIEHRRLMEDGRLDKVDRLGMSSPNSPSPRVPPWSPVVGHEGDRTLVARRDRGEVILLQQSGRGWIPNSVQRPHYRMQTRLKGSDEDGRKESQPSEARTTGTQLPSRISLPTPLRAVLFALRREPADFALRVDIDSAGPSRSHGSEVLWCAVQGGSVNRDANARSGKRRTQFSTVTA